MRLMLDMTVIEDQELDTKPVRHLPKNIETRS